MGQGYPAPYSDYHPPAQLRSTRAASPPTAACKTAAAPCSIMSNPDLASILQILANTTGASQPPQQPPPPELYQAPAHSYASTTPDPRLAAAAATKPAPQTHVPPPSIAPASQPSRIDPRTIKDYPSAVQYVTRVLSQDEELLFKIKRLKDRQHEHERMWWQGRVEITERHKNRAETGKSVEAVLRSLGAAPSPAGIGAGIIPDEDELKQYDRKVYKRSAEMAEHMGRELGLLGVPLFCGDYDAVPKEELAGMRKKLVELLEIICSD